MDAHLLPLIDRLAGRHVLCVGDVMLDRFVYGRADRISPEAPIPVLRVDHETPMPGGAGNTVRNVAALDSSVTMIGVVGDDDGAEELLGLFAALPGVKTALVVDPTRPTTRKTRFVAGSQQLLRVDREASAPVSADIENALLERIADGMQEAEAVILSDYVKGVLTPRVIAETVRLAAARGIAVLVDPKGRDFSRYRGATLLTPNRAELAEATGMAVTTPIEVEAATRSLMAESGVQGILTKLGGEGVCLIVGDGSAQRFRAETRAVFDVSGAGDTVIAALALGVAGGLDVVDAAALANIAGSVAVSKPGTATVSRAELAAEVAESVSGSAESKLMTWEHAAAMAERWRRQGLRVGFTNGCFDLLHPGHLSLIRQARAACDRLFVGLNSDSSVRLLGKGENRPLQNENARATVLAALADVDGVVIFNESTPIELLKALRPALLVKGADYRRDQVVGGDMVEGWGGEVMLANLIEGQSTTSIVKRMGKAG